MIIELIYYIGRMWTRNWWRVTDSSFWSSWSYYLWLKIKYSKICHFTKYYEGILDIKAKKKPIEEISLESLGIKFETKIEI